MQYIMPYSKHMSLTALLEHIGVLLKYVAMFAEWICGCLPDI